MHNLYVSVQAEKSELVLQRHALIDVGCGMDEHIYKLHARRPKHIGKKQYNLKWKRKLHKIDAELRRVAKVAENCVEAIFLAVLKVKSIERFNNQPVTIGEHTNRWQQIDGKRFCPKIQTYIDNWMNTQIFN